MQDGSSYDEQIGAPATGFFRRSDPFLVVLINFFAGNPDPGSDQLKTRRHAFLQAFELLRCAQNAGKPRVHGGFDEQRRKRRIVVGAAGSVPGALRREHGDGDEARRRAPAADRRCVEHPRSAARVDRRVGHAEVAVLFHRLGDDVGRVVQLEVEKNFLPLAVEKVDDVEPGASKEDRTNLETIDQVANLLDEPVRFQRVRIVESDDDLARSRIHPGVDTMASATMTAMATEGEAAFRRRAAAALSFCLPGLGHLYTGAIGRGLALNAAFLLLLSNASTRLLVPAVAIFAAWEARRLDDDYARNRAALGRWGLFALAGGVGVFLWSVVVFGELSPWRQVQRTRLFLERAARDCRAGDTFRANCVEGFVDGWGRKLVVGPDGNLRSTGRDGVDGTLDDIVFPRPRPLPQVPGAFDMTSPR